MSLLGSLDLGHFYSIQWKDVFYCILVGFFKDDILKPCLYVCLVLMLCTLGCR